MKAVHCVKYGSHKDLVVVDVERPGKPQTGQVKVDVKTTGIQFSDLVRIAGEYQDSTEPPFTVGGDAGGLIAEVGEGVEGFEVGDRVITPAGCVEEINISARAVTKLPAGTDLELAASFRNNYATGLWGLQYGRLQPGETLLVHGAAGGVGLAAVDLGKLFGATVIATASSDDKLEVVKTLGADHTINYTDGFRDAVKDLTGGRGADVIYDPIGGDMFDQVKRCVNWEGRIVIIGFASGRIPEIECNRLLLKNMSVVGLAWGQYLQRSPAKGEACQFHLYEMLAEGKIDPLIYRELPFNQAIEGLRLMDSRELYGKIVITR